VSAARKNDENPVRVAHHPDARQLFEALVDAQREIRRIRDIKNRRGLE
jgi:hypothetical protein